MIEDGQTIFGSGFLEGLHRQRLAAVARRRGQPLPSLDRVEPDASALLARVQTADLGAGALTHWVVDCECKTASAVWKDVPWTFCAGCWNRAFRGRLRPVAFPDADTVAEIDRLLSLRPERQRFWHSDESLEQLAAENAEHGWGVQLDI